MTRLGLPVLIVALFGALATPASAQRIRTIFAQHQLPIRSGQVEVVKVTCPPGYEATGGSTYPLPFDVKLLKSVSRGAERIFLFEPAGYGATTVTLVVTCLKKVVFRPLPKIGKVGFRIVLKKRRGPVIRVAPESTEKSRLKCPGGTAPAGHGFDVTPVPGGGSVRPAQTPSKQPGLRPVEKMPVRGGFEFGVQHVEGPPANVRMDATCASRTQTGRRGRKRFKKRFQVIRRTIDETVEPGANGSEQACPRGFAPLEAGFDVPDGSPVHRLGSHPNERRGASWLWLNNSSSPQRVTLYLLCAEGAQRTVVRRD